MKSSSLDRLRLNQTARRNGQPNDGHTRRKPRARTSIGLADTALGVRVRRDGSVGRRETLQLRGPASSRSRYFLDDIRSPQVEAVRSIHPLARCRPKHRGHPRRSIRGLWKCSPRGYSSTQYRTHAIHTESGFDQRIIRSLSVRYRLWRPTWLHRWLCLSSI